MKLFAFLTLALMAARQARAESLGSDFRIRGYTIYAGVAGGSSSCSDSFLVACSSMGQLGVRASTDALKLLPPSTGWALFHGQMITCPETVANISSDSNGQNQQAMGSFRMDAITPVLVPYTPFVVTPGGNPSSLLLRTLTTQCIYEFTLTQSTSFILGVQPLEWSSLFNAASVQVASPMLALLSSLGAVAVMWALR